MQPTILEDHGNPVSFTCEAPVISSVEKKDTDTDATKMLQFQFDYEFVMKDPRESLVEVFYEDLPVLEWGILWMAVQAVGLDTCILDNQDIQKWRAGGGRRLQGTRSMIEESHVISLSSTRTDVLDPTVESCEYLVDIAEDMICLPMRGKMMARYTGDDTQAVERYLLYHIQTEMDSQSVLVRQIQQILFLGDRATYGMPELQPISRDSYMGLAVGLSLSAGLLTMALYAILTRRWRRRREDSRDVYNIGKDDIVGISTQSSESNNSQDFEVPSTNHAAERQTMEIFMDDISDCPSDSPALHPQDLALHAKMVDVLPPLGPNQPTKPRSKPMQKRRRKKKKVRTRKLTRTNSRESINEMETITESNEEVLSGDDDDTSEYYSTDDDDSVDRTSRDPSPARSLTGSLGSAASGGSGGVPPSPIKEEPDPPKIRRLPPPYV
jgi:hypothetical protein